MYSEMNNSANSIIPILDIYTMELKTPETNGIWARMFYATLFILAQNWEHLECSLIG